MSKEIFGRIERCLNDHMFIITLVKGKKDMFKQCFSELKKNVEEMENDQSPSDVDIDKVKKTLKTIKYIIMEEPLNTRANDFFNDWIYLVYNWNENTMQDNQIREETQVCLRFNQNYITMKEMMDNLKHLNNKLRNLQNWNPPAFEIAKNFINYLED